jgi:NADPH:quinone reductase-like Zn-dependent oxidoreductase
MKAALLEALNQALQFTELPTPQPQANEALVALKAAALNHRDVWIQKGLYPGLRFPVLLGSDGAGVVEAVGEGVEHTWVGQEVIINPGLYWGNDDRFYGKDFRILGMPDAGTFAEYIRIPARYLHAKPAHLSFEEAAALPLAGLTGYRALFGRAKLQAGERVLITGIGGGVALFVLQFAVAAGAEVWVTSGSDDKIASAVAMGATGGVNYHLPKYEKELVAKAGLFDVIIDSAAGPGFAKLIDAATPGGRIVFYGGTMGNITDVIPAKIFFKQLNIMGTTMGTEAEFADMVRFVDEHQLKPVVDKTYLLADAELAMRRMDKGQQFGKIVLKI